MISKEMVRKGIESGVIQFAANPALGPGITCIIGTGYLYIGGKYADGKSPEEFLRNAGVDKVVDDVYSILEKILLTHDFKGEYDYHEKYLRENVC